MKNLYVNRRVALNYTKHLSIQILILVKEQIMDTFEKIIIENKYIVPYQFSIKSFFKKLFQEHMSIHSLLKFKDK